MGIDDRARIVLRMIARERNPAALARAEEALVKMRRYPALDTYRLMFENALVTRKDELGCA